MKKQYLVLAISSVLLSGCELNPFGARLNQAKEVVKQADEAAQRKAASYKPQKREIKPYKGYRYQAELSDPFQVREFVESEPTEVTEVTPEKTEKCEPPKCVPPEPHPKSLLENYSLASLEFVGTLGSSADVALIKTPDYGVLKVRVGEYLGNQNGKVLAIKESAIVIQEKVFKAGTWEDKKTVLTIKR